MADDKTPKDDDDSYVLEDTGESIEDIEQEMKVAAQEADDTLSSRHGTAPPASADEAAEIVSDDLRKAQDRYLRTLADFENYRKRADRERDDFRRYALTHLLRDLLPVLDNFDRALDHAEEGDDFHKGVLLIYKQLYDVLRKAGLKPIEAVGVRFNPNIHEAVIREEDPTVPSHTVTSILQKGYYLHDRLLRPALVKVAVGGPEQGDVVQ
ncbi:MAG TPA: nucleotide exchange factor GrpE [Thermoanaerobaculia bacterium]|jgi:molecular chaperone GrpE|nr:nucleotide exchange factor GrpE [Thermoanaerobaculia bacterium]